MNFMKWALHYASKGMYVFPLSPGTKIPLANTSGHNDATTDPERIVEWWKDYPDANIGLNCGKSGIVVVDVDTKDGKVGSQSLFAVAGDDLHLLDTVRSKTWSGGEHLFYKGSCPCSQSELGQNLDIKGEGGYVVLAPSRISEKGKTGTYEWKKGYGGEKLEFLDFPDKLRPLAKDKVPLKEIEHIFENSRHSTIVRFGGFCRHIGMTVPEIISALHAINEERCVPPLPRAEVDKIAKSMGIYLQGEVEPVKPPEYGFKTAKQILERASDRAEWIVENLIRQSAVCLLSASPGAGKSTLMRTLASCVANGESFLHRHCRKGLVGWVGLEESDQDLSDAIEDMALLENDNIVYAGISDIPPDGRIKFLEAFIIERNPSLVIIDTLGEFFEIKDINHYSDTGNALKPLMALRARYGTAFMLLHHNSKVGTPLGSTKIVGAVDLSMSITVSEDGIRSIETGKMRSGIPIQDTALHFDIETRKMSSETSPKWRIDQDICERKILAYLKPGMEVLRQALVEHSGRKGSVARNAVDGLLAQGIIVSSGQGVKGSPKLFMINPSRTFCETYVPEEFPKNPEELSPIDYALSVLGESPEEIPYVF